MKARGRIIDLFTKELGYRHETDLGLDPTVQQLRKQLRAFCTSAERREDDLVVVYLSGHGEIDDAGGGHMLLMSDTDPTDIPFTSLPTAELVRVLGGTRVRRLLLLLDTCYSGQGGNELAAAALERLGGPWAHSTTGPGLVIVSSAQPHQQAKAGLFPDLFAEAVGSQATAGHAPAHLSVSAVVQRMNEHVDKPAYQRISLSLLGLTGEPPDFLTNPRHDFRLTDVDLALQEAAEFDSYARRRETEFTSRLLVRAMGYHGDATHGWWFCGRHQVLAELASWLNHDGDGDGAKNGTAPRELPAGSVRVVTAGPGSGKTAVLGLVAALVMPDRRRTVPLDALGFEPEWIPAEDSIDVVMYAQNLTNPEVLSGLAAAAGLQCATVGEFLEGLEHRTGDRNRAFTVLIDALDEAATPSTLCSQIVRPLIEHSRGRIRLLLGTRPYLLDSLGIPADDRRRVLDLDSARYADREALLSYTMRNLLQSRRTSPYREADPGLLQAVAEAVANAAGRSFLVARYAAYTLASAEETVPDPYEPRWRAGLPRHAGQAMRDDLTRRLGPEARRAMDLLRPLAYAEGQGLPWEGIWALLASAVSGRSYTDEDLLWLRRNAGSYVVEATENGRSAYRLYHQALTEHLRENTDTAAVHCAYVDVLTEDVPYRGDATRDWSRAHPYTLHHLAAHAAASSRVDDLLAVPEYLVHAVPRSLTPHLKDASTPQARLTAAVYRTSYDVHSTAVAPVRRSVLALNAARAGAASLLAQLNSHAHTGGWLPAWATGHDFAPALRHTLTGHSDHVRFVACTALEGRPVAVVGDWDEAKTWNLSTGHTIGDPLTAFDGLVQALTCTSLDGRPVIVVATAIVTDTDIDQRVYARDLATGRPVGEPLTGLDGEVKALACSVLDGRPVAVIATDTDTGGRVHARDLATGQPVGEPLTGLNGVHALACTVIDGRPVTVIGIGVGEGRVHVRDLATGQSVGEPLTGLDRDVGALACTDLDGRPVTVVATGTGFGSGRVHVRDLATGQPVGEPLTGLDGRVYALACTVIDGRPVTVTVDAGGSVRSWDVLESVVTTAPTSAPRGGRVNALACAVLDGHPVTVIATDTGTGTGTGGRVHARDLATGQPVGNPITGLGSVQALACAVLDSRPVTVIATSTGLGASRVDVRDLVTGKRIGTPLTRLHGQVQSLTCAVLDGRPVIVVHTFNSLVGDAYGGWLYLGDLSIGKRISESPLGPMGMQAMACTVLDDRPVTVTAAKTGAGVDESQVRVRDLATGKQIGQPLTGLHGVQALACTVLDGRPVAVIATGTGTGTGRVQICVQDMATGQLMGESLTGLHARVEVLACTLLDGRPVIAMVTDTGSLHVRDVRSQSPLQHLVVEGLRDAAFSPDGSLVLTMGRDVAVLRHSSGT